jgi:hypothetical protein
MLRKVDPSWQTLGIPLNASKAPCPHWGTSDLLSNFTYAKMTGTSEEACRVATLTTNQ